MTSYIVDGEVLSYLRAFNKIPGERKYLKKESDFLNIFEGAIALGMAGYLPGEIMNIYNIKNIKDPVNKHKLSSVLSKEEQ